MNLEDLNVFKLSMEISEVIWNEIFKWNYFQKNTVGSQLIRAVDSISANIAEGFGRYSFKENKQFCYYSRGSLYETKVWLKKAAERKLIDKQSYDDLSKKLDILGVKLNNYINTIGKQQMTTNDYK
jgi:four helix bundle protein